MTKRWNKCKTKNRNGKLDFFSRGDGSSGNSGGGGSFGGGGASC